MKERPILFNGAMVRALLDGSKTQTRRIMRDQVCAPGIVQMSRPGYCEIVNEHGVHIPGFHCPYGQPGDWLWVKETWRPWPALDPWDLNITYSADGEDRTIRDGAFGERDWSMPKAAARGNVSPLFMPRWASRITLEVTGVRVERLNDCSNEDAEAEGVKCNMSALSFSEHYRALWNAINGAGSWDANPWIWVVEFERITP